VDDKSVTEPVPKRADQLVVGDRIQPGHMPAYARSGEGRVMLVDPYEYRGAKWVFVAFACADGDRNCAHYLPDGEVLVVPADDPEITQPIGERRLVNEGGVWAVPVAGGAIEVDPPEGFVPASGEGDR